MGNRAIIKPIDSNIGVYLHWNGGYTSVTAFLKYCEMKGYRDFGGKFADGYGIARFCQIVGNYFGGTLSIGIQTNVEATEDYAEGLDNGIYIIDGWRIVDNIGGYGEDNYDLMEMLIDIDKSQPTEEQLGEDYIKADEVDALDLEIGDEVFVRRYDNIIEKYTVQGFADDSNLPDFNRPLMGSPFIDMYNDVNGKINPNNFLTGKVRRVKREV